MGQRVSAAAASSAPPPPSSGASMPVPEPSTTQTETPMAPPEESGPGTFEDLHKKCKGT